MIRLLQIEFTLLAAPEQNVRVSGWTSECRLKGGATCFCHEVFSAVRQAPDLLCEFLDLLRLFQNGQR